MDIKATSELPKSLPNGCVVVAVFSDGSLTPSATLLDKLCDGALKKIVKQGDISGKSGETLMLRHLPNCLSDRVLLVGVGDQPARSNGAITEGAFRTTLSHAMTAIRATQSANVINTLTEIDVQDRDIAWKCFHASQQAFSTGYRYQGDSATKGKAKKNTQPALKKMLLLADKSAHREVKKQITAGLSTAKGSCMAMELGNLPPNICTPTYLADLAKKLGKQSDKLSVTIVEEKQMEKLGMHAFLSVSRGSRLPGKLIVMNYQGSDNKKAQPTVLVGKGITFDTGGISIKPSGAMDEMKFDMCGAASVFGVVESLLALKPKQNVICVVAAAENMPDGDASRPGDVVKTMSGQSVEILNTDAEGRLVLCDTLTYVERFKPAAVIDIATLTGACIVALGHVGSALMSNNDELANTLLKASRSSGDKTWQLPLWDEYQTQLDSNFADMGNIGGAPAGSITAGCFLSRFAKAYKWAHLDIAGVAWRSGKEKGATGRPVPLLMQYLLDNA